MRPRGAWPPGAADPTVLSTPLGLGPAVRSSGRDLSSVLTHSAPSRYSLSSVLPSADQPWTLPSCTRFCPLKTTLILITLILEARHTLSPRTSPPPCSGGTPSWQACPHWCPSPSVHGPQTPGGLLCTQLPRADHAWLRRDSIFSRDRGSLEPSHQDIQQVNHPEGSLLYPGNRLRPPHLEAGTTPPLPAVGQRRPREWQSMVFRERDGQMKEAWSSSFRRVSPLLNGAFEIIAQPSCSCGGGSRGPSALGQCTAFGHGHATPAFPL